MISVYVIMFIMNYEVNKIEVDEFGRPSGVLLINKPRDITSHDIVDRIRKIFKTRKVGHAGTLDPFATGILIVLVGKATKLSDQFLGLDKAYEAKMLIGISTWTGDIEGEIKDFFHHELIVESEDLRNAFSSFQPSYSQYVPLFSSVKVGGRKLRVLARKYPKKQLIQLGDVKKYLFKDLSNKPVDEVEIPKKNVKIKDINIIGRPKKLEIKTRESEFQNQNEHVAVIKLKNSYLLNPSIVEFAKKNAVGFYSVVDFYVECSKGTYIRQLAEDIGERIGVGVPSMLVELERTKIGNYTLEEAVDIDKLSDTIN